MKTFIPGKCFILSQTSKSVIELMIHIGTDQQLLNMNVNLIIKIFQVCGGGIDKNQQMASQGLPNDMTNCDHEWTDCSISSSHESSVI